VELQDFALRGVTCQLSYPLSTRYPDVRGRFLEELTAEIDLPEWGWGDEYLNFTNKDRGLTLIAGGRESRSQFESIVDVEDVVATTARLFEKAVDEFNVQEVGYIGVRTFWTAAVDDFDRLQEWARESLLSAPLRSASERIGVLSDLGSTLEFMGADPKHRLQIGPMKREQLLGQILRGAEVDEVPESFLYLDLDRIYNETVFVRDDALKRWEESLRRNLDLAERFAAELTGMQSVR